MSRYILISFFVIGFYSFAFSQTIDTVYYGEDWKPCKKRHHKYYRLRQKTDSGYKIQDFYKSGVLQMDATAISINPDILNGPVKFYFPDGKIKTTGFYDNYKAIGVWCYYNSTGQIASSYNYSAEGTSDVYRQSMANNIPEKSNRKAMSEIDKNFSIAVRGKLFGFFIIEDTYFSTATIGTELLFKGRHSLGIDYTYFGWQYEKDNSKDEGLYETYERRGYLYFDYKYRFLSYRVFDFYFNLYDKIGTYHMWQEGVSEGYNGWEKPWLNDKTDGTFNQVGAGLGFKNYFSEQFYIDISANGGKLFSNNNTITHDSLGIADKQYNIKSDKNIFYIRINFGYKLFVKKNKKEQDVFYTN